MYNKPSQQRYGRTCITVAKKKKTSSSVLMTKSLIRSQLADGPPDRFRRGHPVSLLGPSGADQQEAQDGCQNGQLWLGVPLRESREMLFGENAIRRPQAAGRRSQSAGGPPDRFRRGRPVKASRYALRVSRSVVVSLSLSRRNAASESEPVMYGVYITFQAGRPLGRPLRIAKKHWNFPVLFS